MNVFDEVLKKGSGNTTTLSLKVMMTNKCNQNCKYCYEQHAIDSKKWTDATLDEMLDHVVLSNATTKIIDFFGGEPLLEKDIILSFLHRNKEVFNKNKIQVCMTTNGVLMDEQTVDTFATIDNAYITFSFDTVFEDLDHRNMDMEKSLDVLAWINDYSSIFGVYNTSITSVINPNQVIEREFFANYDAMYMSGARTFAINPIMYYNDQLADWGEDNVILKLLIGYVKTLVNRYPDINVIFSNEVSPRSTANCMAGGKILSVDGSGDVTGCFFFSNDKDKYKSYVLGNIFDGSVSENIESIVGETDGFFEANEVCSSCPEGLCVICPAGSNMTSGNMMSTNPVCRDIVTAHCEIDKFSEKNRKEIASKIEAFNKTDGNNS